VVPPEYLQKARANKEPKAKSTLRVTQYLLLKFSSWSARRFSLAIICSRLCRRFKVSAGLIVILSADYTARQLAATGGTIH
jgi:hypothetical protein